MWEGFGPPKKIWHGTYWMLRSQGEVKKIDNRFNCLTGTNIGLHEVLCLAKCECD